MVQRGKYDKRIHKLLRQVRKRQLVQKEIFCLSIYLAVAAGLAFALNLAAISYPIYQAAAYGWYLLGASLLLSCIHTFACWPSEKAAAACADSAGLQERCTTSVELYGKEDELSLLQKQDTLRHLEKLDAKRALPYQWYLKRFACDSLLLAAFLVCMMIPSPAKEEAERIHALKDQVAEQQELVKDAQKLVEEKEKDGTLSREEAEELKDTLAIARKELSQAKESHDVEKVKERLENKLVKQLAQQTDKELLQKLQKLASGTDLEANSEYQRKLKELADKSHVLKKARKELEGLDVSGAKKKKLTQELEKALSDGEVTAMELSEALESLQDGEAAVARDTIASQLAQGGSGQPSSASPSQNNPGTDSGQSPGNSSGKNAGKAGSKSQGNTSAQSSAAAGQANNAGNGGKQAGNGQNQGGGYNTGSSEGKESSEEAVQESVTVSGKKIGQDGNLTGSRRQGNSRTEKTQQTQGWAGNKVEYGAVVGEYSDKAYARLDQSKVPSQMKDIVKEYFSSLE